MFVLEGSFSILIITLITVIFLQGCAFASPYIGKDVFFDESLRKVRSCSTICDGDGSGGYGSACKEKCPYYLRVNVFYNEVLKRWQNCSTVCDPPNRYDHFCTEKCPNYTSQKLSAPRTTEDSLLLETMTTPGKQSNSTSEYFIFYILTLVIFGLVLVAGVSCILHHNRKWILEKIKRQKTTSCIETVAFPVQETGPPRQCSDVENAASRQSRKQSILLKNERLNVENIDDECVTTVIESRSVGSEQIKTSGECEETMLLKAASRNDMHFKHPVQMKKSSSFYSNTTNNNVCRPELNLSSLVSSEPSQIHTKQQDFYDISKEKTKTNVDILPKKHRPSLRDTTEVRTECNDFVEDMDRKIDNENSLMSLENNESEAEELDELEGCQKPLMSKVPELAAKTLTFANPESKINQKTIIPSNYILVTESQSPGINEFHSTSLNSAQAELRNSPGQAELRKVYAKKLQQTKHNDQTEKHNGDKLHVKENSVL